MSDEVLANCWFNGRSRNISHKSQNARRAKMTKMTRMMSDREKSEAGGLSVDGEAIGDTMEFVYY